jgi:hypothetical protein
LQAQVQKCVASQSQKFDHDESFFLLQHRDRVRALFWYSIVDEADARREVLGQSKARKKQRLESRTGSVMLANLHSAVVIMDKHITKCLLGQDYDYNASLRVVGAALRMQKAHLQKVAKLRKIKGKQASGETLDQRDHL